jgi:hypothetical protein
MRNREQEAREAGREYALREDVESIESFTSGSDDYIPWHPDCAVCDDNGGWYDGGVWVICQEPHCEAAKGYRS